MTHNTSALEAIFSHTQNAEQNFYFTNEIDVFCAISLE